MNIELLISVLEQSFIFSIVALGSYISYKILNFPDLSVEGSFPLGAAATAIMIVNGFNPYLACLIAIILGAISGILTGVIHVKLKITDLLSGIIVLTGLYSINLLIAGKANLPFFNKITIFTNPFDGKDLNGFTQFISDYYKLIIAFFICIIIKIVLDIYLKTKSGLLLRSAGDNIQFVTSLAKDAGFVKILGLSLANALSALAGSIWCQYQRVFDVNMGKGVIIIALSSVIIGTNIFKRIKFLRGTTMAILGCILYNTVIAFAIAIGINSDYMNLVTAILFLIALVLNGDKIKIRRSNANA